MRSQPLLTSLLLATLALTPAPARADVIATFPVTFDEFLANQPANDPSNFLEVAVGVRPTLSFLPPSVPYPGPNPLFEGTRWTTADVGRTWTATPANDADFATFASLLTNGQNDLFWAVSRAFSATTTNPSSTGGATGRPELGLFNNALHPDLAGFQIDSITLRLDNFTVTENYPGPEVPGRFYDARATLIFEGIPIPEPSLTPIMAISATLLLSRRRPGAAE